jgi:hypothetical protein
MYIFGSLAFKTVQEKLLPKKLRSNTRTGFFEKIKEERNESQMTDTLKIANDFVEFGIIQWF